jgi:hypothetical protein
LSIKIPEEVFLLWYLVSSGTEGERGVHPVTEPQSLLPPECSRSHEEANEAMMVVTMDADEAVMVVMEAVEEEEVAAIRELVFKHEGITGVEPTAHEKAVARTLSANARDRETLVDRGKQVGIAVHGGCS